jgi:hypothetical protein
MDDTIKEQAGLEEMKPLWWQNHIGTLRALPRIARKLRGALD